MLSIFSENYFYVIIIVMYTTLRALSGFFQTGGMTKSMSNVLAYLTICEPSTQTASDIESTLHLSKGSVNTALNGLLRAKIIQCQLTSKGGRFLEYQLDAQGWERAITYRLSSLRAAVQVADDALVSAPHNERLHAMREAYVEFLSQFNNLTKKDRQT